MSGQTIGGIYDQNRAVTNRNVIKPASDFGDVQSHWNGVDFSIDTRLQNGVLLQGGFSTGKTMNDYCDVIDEVPEVLSSTTAPTGVLLVGIGAPAAAWTPAGFCHQETPFLTQYKAVGAYTLPYGVRISGTFQSVPGPVIAANQIYTGVLPSLGRPFFAGQSTVNVVEPGTSYGDRLNQVDFRFSKLLQRGDGAARPERGPVQRLQRRHNPDAAERVRRDMAERADGYPASVREVQRAVGFLDAEPGTLAR